MTSYSHIPNTGTTYRVECLKKSIGAWYFDRQYRKIDEARNRLSQLKSELGDSYQYRIVKYTKIVEVVEEK